MMKLRTLLTLLISAVTVPLLQGQEKYADAITVQSSKQHLDILAGEEFGGRGTGQNGKGGRLAEEYIAKHFKAYGLTPIAAKGTYFQPVPVMLYDEGEPVDQGGNSLITGTSEKSEWTKNRFKRVQEITKLKPKLVIACSPSINSQSIRKMNALFGGVVSLDQGEEFTSAPKSDTYFLPVIHVTEQVADKLFGQGNTSLAKFKELAAIGVEKSIVLEIKIRTEMGQLNERFADSNVIGVLPGADLKDEYVVVCGHYDHEGILADGTYFPGADDNGSGSTAVLELARAHVHS